MTANGKVVVTLKIADGWHIYANPVGNEKLLESQTEMTVFVNGEALEGRGDVPEGEGTQGHRGRQVQRVRGRGGMAAISARLRDAKIEARVKVIACKDGKCLLPSVIKVK